METFIKKVRDHCIGNGLLAQGDRVLLGLSGGADSVCLFFVLLELAQEMKLSIFPVHIHHEIRGEEADRDLEFCRNLCEKNGLYLVEKHFDVKAIAAEKGMSVEEAGRMVRYAEFDRLAKGLCCNRIAVAHHKNDQAETVLFHMFRGSRLKGLAGIEPRRGMIVRPLLCVSRNEIEEYLKNIGQEYCTDSTNLEDEYSRNRIRHQIVPLAEEICPGATDHISKIALYIQDVEKYLERQTDALCQIAVEMRPEEMRVNIRELQRADKIISERLIYKILCDIAGAKKDITSDHVRLCMELCDRQTGREISLINGITVKKKYDDLCFVRAVKEEKEEIRSDIFEGLRRGLEQTANPEKSEEQEDRIFRVEVKKFPCAVMHVPGIGKMTFDLISAGTDIEGFIEKNGGIPKSTYTKWFDYDKIGGDLVLRMPEKTDSITVYSDGKSKKIYDVFTDYKIPREERDGVVVLCDDKGVIWIPGIRSSEAYRIGSDTKHILIVSMSGR